MDELLKKLGLTDEQVKGAKDVLASEINGKYIPKTRFDEVNTDAKAVKAELEKLKKEGNVEDLNKKITELTSTMDLKQKEYEKRERDLLIDGELGKSGTKNVKALKGLIDFEKVQIKDGKVEGLNEQLNALKTSDAYLFGQADADFGKGPNPTPGKDLNGIEKAFYSMNPNLKP